MQKLMDGNYVDLSCTREGECVICNETKDTCHTYYTDAQRFTDNQDEAQQAFHGDGWLAVNICDQCYKRMLLEDDEETNELLEEENNLMEILKRLFNKELIQIEVNISPEHAPQGDGKWNVTHTYVTIGNEKFEFTGSVEIIEGV